MSLDKQFKKQLVAKSQQLKPVVIIGNNGLTDNVLTEIAVALDAHELIKIRINASDREERKAMTDSICEKSQAEFIQGVGHVVSVYREKKSS